MPSLIPRLIVAAGLVLGAGSAQAAKDLVIAVSDNLTGLDPADLNDNISQAAARMMCQGLYILDKDMKLVPGLAESYEANEEATQFIFHLRHGVTFQDGTPFNAEAVKLAYDRAGNPENHLKRQSLFVMINHTDVIDDYTVKLTLKYPFGAMINDLAHPGALIVSPTAVQKWGKEFTRHPVCTGPYEFVSWSADTLKLKKNEHYWKPGLPKFDTITYRNIPENGARLAALQAGEVQFIYPVPPEMIKSLEGNPAIKIFNEQSILSLYVTMHTQRKPFDDVRVRQALNYAINKQAFIKVVLSGYADEMDSMMPPRLGYYERQGTWPYDPAKAKQLLAEAGYPNGFETVLTGGVATLAQRAMQFLQQQLAAVGVKVRVEGMEAGVLTSKIFNVKGPDDASIVMLNTGWSSSTGDADWGARPMLYTKAFPPVLSNIAWYSKKDVDAAIEAGLATVDPTKRAAAYAKEQEVAWKDAPWIYLVTSHNLAAYSANLTGVTARPDAQVNIDDDAEMN
jgi:glutathione transport system substrate-binding protein